LRSSLPFWLYGCQTILTFVASGFACASTPRKIDEQRNGQETELPCSIAAAAVAAVAATSCCRCEQHLVQYHIV
jgi:hypothetical protein